MGERPNEDYVEYETADGGYRAIWYRNEFQHDGDQHDIWTHRAYPSLDAYPLAERCDWLAQKQVALRDRLGMAHVYWEIILDVPTGDGRGRCHISTEPRRLHESAPAVHEQMLQSEVTTIAALGGPRDVRVSQTRVIAAQLSN